LARQRGFQRQSHGSGQRRLTAWDEGVAELSETTVTASGTLLWNAGVTLVQESRATVVRTRGLVDAFIIGPGIADGDGFAGAHGIGIVSSDAFAAGAVPDPLTDSSWPGWLWYEHFEIRDPDVSNAATRSSSGFQRSVIDSKAMRKWGNAETMFGASEFVEIGGANMIIRADTRFLIKLT